MSNPFDTFGRVVETLGSDRPPPPPVEFGGAIEDGKAIGHDLSDIVARIARLEAFLSKLAPWFDFVGDKFKSLFGVALPDPFKED